MKKILLLLAVSVLLLAIGCNSPSVIDGVWENEISIIEFDSKADSYRGLGFEGSNWSKSLSIESEQEDSLRFLTDGKPFDASIKENELVLTDSEGQNYAYRRYQGDSYSSKALEELLDGKWSGIFFGIEIVLFFDVEAGRMEMYTLGESLKEDYKVEVAIGNWVMFAVTSSDDPTVLIVKDRSTISMKTKDNEDILLTKSSS